MIVSSTSNGGTVYETIIVLVNGPYLDVVIAANDSAIAASDVQSLAQAAATRLNAAAGS
jgi:hypothetical protein